MIRGEERREGLSRDTEGKGKGAAPISKNPRASPSRLLQPHTGLRDYPEKMKSRELGRLLPYNRLVVGVIGGLG